MGHSSDYQFRKAWSPVWFLTGPNRVRPKTLRHHFPARRQHNGDSKDSLTRSALYWRKLTSRISFAVVVLVMVTMVSALSKEVTKIWFGFNVGIVGLSLFSVLSSGFETGVFWGFSAFSSTLLLGVGFGGSSFIIPFCLVGFSTGLAEIKQDVSSTSAPARLWWCER